MASVTMDPEQFTGTSAFDVFTTDSLYTEDDYVSSSSFQTPDLESTTMGSVLHSMTKHIDKKTVQSIFGPIMFTVVIIGFIGNTTSFIIMSTKSFRHLAISRVIRSLAISDVLYLLSIINNQPWYREMIGIDLRGVNESMCKLINWTTRSAAIFSAWMVILLAAERFFAIWFFEITGKVFSVRKMTICIVTIVTLTATFNAVWTNHSDAIVNGVCIANAKRDLITKNFLLACVILYVGIPAPILFILNILIIFKLWSHSKRTKASGSIRIPHHRVTAMLLGVTIVFIVLVPPIALCHMIAQMMGDNLFATNNITLFIVGQTAQLMFELNCAINFFLYVVMGSTFRSKLNDMICGPCRKVPIKRGTSRTAITKISKSSSQNNKDFNSIENEKREAGEKPENVSQHM